MKLLGSIKNNTGYTGVQFISEFHSHGGIILNIANGVMTIITHGCNDGSMPLLRLVERLIDKYSDKYIIEIVCCFSTQVFCANNDNNIRLRIKYYHCQVPVRMDCRTSGRIIFSVSV